MFDSLSSIAGDAPAFDGGRAMLELYYKYPRVLKRFRSGSLGKQMDHIAAELSRLGYKRSSARVYLSNIARFSSFAAVSRRGDRMVGPAVIKHYLGKRPTLSSRVHNATAINLAIKFASKRFRREHLIKKQDANDRLIAAYQSYLLKVRGLQPKTCEGMTLTARRMIAWVQHHLPVRALSQLTGEHAIALTRDFLARLSNDYTRSSTTAYIRSFLHYLRWADINDTDLATVVPRTPTYHLAHLPPRIEWQDVRRAIDAIDITSAGGVRDRALMLLIATTGLRNGEVRRLELQDIHWDAGEVLVRRAKSGQDRVVPLLHEPGKALAQYVLKSRPKACSRRVFLTAVAPARPIERSSTISRAVSCCLRRGGVSVPRGAAHLLRHSLATRLVSQARPINEVADLLGHQHIDTTAIYVKVAIPLLASVALPFPGGAA